MTLPTKVSATDIVKGLKQLSEHFTEYQEEREVLASRKEKLQRKQRVYQRKLERSSRQEQANYQKLIDKISQISDDPKFVEGLTTIVTRANENAQRINEISKKIIISDDEKEERDYLLQENLEIEDRLSEILGQATTKDSDDEIKKEIK